MDISGTQCARARESVSADLDRELQELDLRRLQAHLRVCAECSAWAEFVRATTTQLREAPLEMAGTVAFEPRRRGRTWRVNLALAVAPVAALVASVVVALGGAQHGSLDGRGTTITSLSPGDRSFLRTDSLGPAEQHRVFRAI